MVAVINVCTSAKEQANGEEDAEKNTDKNNTLPTKCV